MAKPLETPEIPHPLRGPRGTAGGRRVSATIPSISIWWDSSAVDRERLAGAWRLLVRPAALAVACGSAFVLVYLVTVRTSVGRLLGDASLEGAILTNPRVDDLVNGVLDVVSVASLLGTVAVIAVIALLRLRRSLGLASVALLVGANGSAWLLKNVVLSRPDLGLREISPATLNSLPSGHSTAAFSAVVALLFVVPARLRMVTAAAGASFATVTALATMSAGWHRAADSVTAFLLVGVWAAMAGIAVVAVGDPTEDSSAAPSQPSHPQRRQSVAAAMCLVAGLTIGAALYTAGPARHSPVASLAAFLAGGLVIAGTATAVAAAVLAVLDQVAPPAAGKPTATSPIGA